MKKTQNMNKNKTIITVLGILSLVFLFAANALTATVQRTNFIVQNLSCTSCLAAIEAELKGLPGAVGMTADLYQGHVTVDHLVSLDHEQIAAIISKLGYPAAMEWTATVSQDSSNRFSAQSKYGSGCSSGGCGVSAGSGTGSIAWKAAPANETVSRTTLQASNLTCTSCLSNIASELSRLPETYGMNGYLSRGIVIVDHAESLENNRIAAIISDLGYPARVLATNRIPSDKAYTATVNSSASNQPVLRGSGCNSRGPCNATAASWQKLYSRYFTGKDSQ